MPLLSRRGAGRARVSPGWGSSRTMSRQQVGASFIEHRQRLKTLSSTRRSHIHKLRCCPTSERGPERARAASAVSCRPMNGVAWNGKQREVVWTIIAARGLSSCVYSAAVDRGGGHRCEVAAGLSASRGSRSLCRADDTGSVRSGNRLKDNQSTFSATCCQRSGATAGTSN